MSHFHLRVQRECFIAVNPIKILFIHTPGTATILYSHEIARFWKEVCPVTFGKQGERLYYDPRVNSESQHATGRPEELSWWGYTRQSHMRNMVAPASEIPGEECEPKLTSGAPGPSKHFHSERWDILSNQSGIVDAEISHLHICITAMVYNPAFPIHIHCSSSHLDCYKGILFRLCRNIKRKTSWLWKWLVTSSVTLLGHSLALGLPSVPIQGEKRSLNDRKLAQRLNHTTEFSEGIYKQIMEPELDLQSSKSATRPFSFQTDTSASIHLCSLFRKSDGSKEQWTKVQADVG